MRKTKSQKGFTLIELLIAVAIIGILASIAMPALSAYRKRAFDTRALADLKNAANGEEAYFVDTLKYVSCADGEACRDVLPGMGPLSEGVNLKIEATNESDPFFTGCATAQKGNGLPLGWHSSNGGIQSTDTIPTFCN
jgi:type IV pilus assembly protein PilA